MIKGKVIVRFSGSYLIIRFWSNSCGMVTEPGVSLWNIVGDSSFTCHKGFCSNRTWLPVVNTYAFFPENWKHFSEDYGRMHFLGYSTVCDGDKSTVLSFPLTLIGRKEFKCRVSPSRGLVSFGAQHCAGRCSVCHGQGRGSLSSLSPHSVQPCERPPFWTSASSAVKSIGLL